MSEAAHHLTADAFIAWASSRPEGERWELANGQPIAMAPERAGHARAKLRIAKRLGAAVRAANLPYEVFVDGMAVQVDATTVYEPDVLLRCGPPLADDAVNIIDPMIIVEIVSPSSGKRDAGIKLADYFRIESVQHYLIVRVEDCTLIHHARADGGQILTRIIRNGAVDFGRGLVLSELFPGG